MLKMIKQMRRWVLLVLLTAISFGCVSGCLVDDPGRHDDHHGDWHHDDDHHDRR